MADSPSPSGLDPTILFFAFMLALFFLWIGEGGPSKPLSFGGPFLTAPGTDSYSESYGPGGIPTLTGLKLPTVSFESFFSSPSTGSGKDEEENTQLPQPTNRSPFTDKIKLEHSSGGPKQTQARNEYVVVYASSNNKEAISVSGWTLESVRSGRKVSIPLGTELPLSGLITEQEKIILKPRDRAYVVSGTSPIGASFRINICMGYFEQYQDFTPSISRSCPRPIDELEEYYDGDLYNDEACETYIKKIPRCTLPSSTPPELSYSCKLIVQNYLHYNGCVRTHQHDADFSQKEWRIYLGTTGNLWREKRETIRLYDAEGKLVDQYSYE